MTLRSLARPVAVAAVLASLLSVLAIGVGTTPAAADIVRPIRFPIYGGGSVVDTFGAPRSGGRTHEGQDIFAPKGRILIAVVDGTVARIQRSNSGLSGNSITIRDAEGWEYTYIHVNNDTPGTDDGANRDLDMFLPGLYPGALVHSGQAIGFVGDSGNAETTPPHLHFEIRDPSRRAADGRLYPINPIDSLHAADRSAPDPSVWAAGMPLGNYEAITLGPGGAVVSGWAFDPNGGASTAEVYVDGYLAGTVPTGRSRGDVAAYYGAGAATSGFNGSVYVPPGRHQVCVFARNSGRGPATGLGCRGVDVPSLPFGNFDAMAVDLGTRTAVVEGWAIDAQTAAPVQIHAYAGGQFVGYGAANRYRSDLAAAFPTFGGNRSFSIQVPLPAGVPSVCLYAIDDADPDRNRALGCRATGLPSGPPFGAIDAVTRVPGGVVMQGWAIDPDTTAPIEVDVWEAGQFRGYAIADRDRPDVATVWPAYGPDHGYAVWLTAGAGAHTWCAYAINVPTGAHPQLGCRTLTLSSAPAGHLDSLTRSDSGVTAVGWGLDPDSADPATVDVYVDGVRVTSVAATGPRPDVATVWPAYGPDRGFATTVPVSAGAHQVCVAVRNVGAGAGDTILRCAQV